MISYRIYIIDGIMEIIISVLVVLSMLTGYLDDAAKTPLERAEKRHLRLDQRLAAGRRPFQLRGGADRLCDGLRQGQ